MADWVDVAPETEFDAGDWKAVDVDGARVAVFKLGGAYYAIEDLCTHDGGVLTGGSVEGEEIVCPRHGARFSIVSGAALTPPAYEDVATFPVRVENGIVQVRDARWD